MPKHRHDRIPETALDWHTGGHGAALATVLETFAAAPRRPGAQLAVSGSGEIAGSVSGGCVEAAVAAEAREALKDGQPRLLEYGVSDEDAFAAGLACGGTIRILVEPVGTGKGPSEGMLAGLVKARRKRRPVVYAVNTGNWERRLIKDAGDPLWNAATEAMTRDTSRLDGPWFLGVHNPPLRLIIVGAVHIAQTLAPMARLADYDVTVIDPREAFATSGRFPKAKLILEWPGEALADFKIDTRTAIVTLTHDAKLDDPALEIAVTSPAFYIGALGSTRTHEKRLRRLAEAGLDEISLKRIHAPIGTRLGAQNPAEIAISILAQITKRLRRPDSRP